MSDSNRKMEFTPDVIVIGAGAAGLAAATKLTRAGINVQILEARERMGGRIFTVSEEMQILRSARNGNSKKNDKNSDTITHKPERVAIELGAEFVHGKPREIWDLIGGSTDQVDEIEGTNWCIRERQVGPCEFFDQVNEFLGRMKITPEDMSFADWARTHPDVPEDIRRRAIAYVEGFNAAHAAKISVNSLVRQSQAEDRIEGDRAFRFRGGYSFVPRTLLGMCNPEHLRISMNTVVKRVELKKGSVIVSTGKPHPHPYPDGKAGRAAGEFRAPRAIVTLPLAVLRSNAVEFRPPLDGKRRALEKLAVGHVIRVTLQFWERFWDSITFNGKTLEGMRFLFTEDDWFPTFWTTMPQRSSLLVAWALATSAERLSGRGEKFQIERAVQTLSKKLNIPHERLDALLGRGYVHDWQADPFARGAYSYVCVGGDDAEQQLAESLDATLFFAGEAADTTGNVGTVHGAVASGYRAAQELMLEK